MVRLIISNYLKVFGSALTFFLGESFLFNVKTNSTTDESFTKDGVLPLYKGKGRAIKQPM